MEATEPSTPPNTAESGTPRTPPACEDRLHSPPSWASLDDLLSDTEADGSATVALSQASARVSRSPGRSSVNRLSLKDELEAAFIFADRDNEVEEPQVDDVSVKTKPGTGQNGTKGSSEVQISDVPKRDGSSSRFAVQKAQKKADLEIDAVDFAELDRKFYDALSSMSDTRLLWRVTHEVTAQTPSPGQRLRTPSDRDTESVYDTVSSTSSSAPLLRKFTDSKNEEAKPLELTKCNPPDTNGKNLLTKTLEQVKKSLEDLAPSPEAELFSKVMGTPSVYKLSRVYLSNLLILSVCFMILYTAFFSLRNLQSSINQQGGLGLAGLACLSASFIVFCLAAPSIVSKVRPKYVLVISMSGHILFELANFYPSFYTIIPSTVLLGCTMSCLWVAQGTYLTSVAVTYATVTGKKHDGIIGLFNGIFLFCLQLAQILGNLMSSFIFNVSLWSDGDEETYANETAIVENRARLGYDLGRKSYREIIVGNMTPVRIHEASTTCGYSYCHSHIIQHADLRIGQNTIYILLMIFIALSLIAMAIMGLFLDKLDVIFHRNKSGMKQQLLSLGGLHREHKIWLLCMLIIFLGMEQAYMFGEVTKAFITCPLGVHMIGYVMVCFGACDSLMSFVCGQIQRTGSTRVLLTLGSFLHLSLLIIALFWVPDPSRVYPVFIFAGALGVADAIWQTQICNIIGCLYPKDREAAFASLRMYEGIGYTLAFSYAQYLCMDVKTYILIGVLVVAMVNYYIMDLLETRRTELQVYPPVDV